MCRWVRSFGIFTIFGMGIALPCFAQSTTTPATASAPTASDNSTPNSASKPADSVPGTKKVWTNDDLGTASRAAVKASGKQSQQYTMTKPADAATVAKVRDNLQRLQKQLDDTEKDLASFKQFQQGDSLVDGAGRTWNKSYSRMPPDQQIAALQEKRKKLQSQIDDLLDEARKKGIEAGQLR